MPSRELLRMRYLGWFHLPDGKKQRAPWITEGEDLDPEELLASELFRGDDVEPITDALAIPESIQDASGLDLYLNALGWNWPADGTEALTKPAWAARTASGAYFLPSRSGLLVRFDPYPTFDVGSGQWIGSPLWAGFLLICTDTKNGTCRPYFPLTQRHLWTLPLEYLSQHRSWLSTDAESTSQWLTTHFATMHAQQLLNAHARPVTIRKKAD